MNLKKKIKWAKLNTIVDMIACCMFLVAALLSMVLALQPTNQTDRIVAAILVLPLLLVTAFYYREYFKDKANLKSLKLKESGICEYYEECTGYPEKCKECARNTLEKNMYIENSR